MATVTPESRPGQGGGCLSEPLPSGTPGLTWTEVPGGRDFQQGPVAAPGLGALGGLGAQHTSLPGLAIVFFRPNLF